MEEWTVHDVNGKDSVHCYYIHRKLFLEINRTKNIDIKQELLDMCSKSKTVSISDINEYFSANIELNQEETIAVLEDMIRYLKETTQNDF